MACPRLPGFVPFDWGPRMATIAAEPFDLDFNPATTALVIIDMQRDFVLPGGFGEALGNDTSLLLTAGRANPARAGEGA